MTNSKDTTLELSPEEVEFMFWALVRLNWVYGYEEITGEDYAVSRRLSNRLTEEDHSILRRLANRLVTAMRSAASDQEQQAPQERLIDVHARLRAQWQLPLSTEEDS